MKKILVSSVAIMLALPFASMADSNSAGTERGDRQVRIAMVKADHQGQRAQARERFVEIRNERLGNQFEQYDLDRNGYITQAELTEVLVNQARERAEQMFLALDADGTGAVNYERFVEFQREWHLQRRESMQGRAIGVGDLSAEDRERIRAAREAAREGRVMGVEARRAAMEARGNARVLRGDAVEVSIDEDGNRVIRIKQKRNND